MKLFASEFGHSYDSYSFAYTIYAEKEREDTLTSIYEKGFLPFSAARDIANTFYMARSVRSDIQNWTPTSENRRVLRKFDDGFTKISRKVTDIRHDESFFALCLSYFNLAHGSAMPRERLEYILDSGLINRVIEYKKDDAIIAYLLPVEGEDFAHYWFSFYKEEYSKTALGMWLALDYIREAQQNNIQYFYFGTCYQEKALYKTNVEPLEYWNGSKWSNDIKTLKALCRSDQERTIDSHKDIYKASLSLF